MDKGSKEPFDENARLMLKVANDDIEAFERLYKRFAPLLMHLFIKWGVSSDSAEDMVNKIFASVWKQRKGFRLETSCGAYFYGMARNIMYEEIHKSYKNNNISLKNQTDSDEGMYMSLSQPEAELYMKQLTEAIEATKTKLTIEQLDALEISQDPNIEVDKMLKKLGCSKEAYKSHLKRARKQLRKSLASFLTDEKG